MARKILLLTIVLILVGLGVYSLFFEENTSKVGYLFQTYAIGCIGGALYCLYSARTYIIKGEFDFSKWRAENLDKSIFSLFLLFFVTLLFTVAPESIELFRFVGLDLTMDGSQASPALLGAIVFNLNYGVAKTMKQVSITKE